ncbi:MAG: PilZ domain-containing protein [Magnetococcales bacterium]|nr:PilZ domain-containing protein [Magnetococcales bacterium]
MQDGDGKRKEVRLLGAEAAVMLLSDGRSLAGHMGDMSLGGMLFVTEEEEPPLLDRGAPVEILLTLYGRESRFSCTVAHQQANKFGLQLHRA